MILAGLWTSPLGFASLRGNAAARQSTRAATGYAAPRSACNEDAPTIAPRAASDHARLERLQRLGALAVVAGRSSSRSASAVRCAPDVVFLLPGGGAAWITDARPVDAPVQQYKQAHVPVATFTRRIEVRERAPRRAVLRVEAARAYRVRVNGALPCGVCPIPIRRGAAGRSVDIASQLRDGENEIAIEVWNPRGPPLLRARLEVGGKTIVADGRGVERVARRRRVRAGRRRRRHAPASERCGGPATGSRLAGAVAGRCSASPSRRWR